MDVLLEPPDDDTVADAVRTAMAHAGIAAEGWDARAPGAWWRAGLAAALDRAPSTAPEPTRLGYATPSPRSTRGAMRA